MGEFEKKKKKSRSADDYQSAIYLVVGQGIACRQAWDRGAEERERPDREGKKEPSKKGQLKKKDAKA